MPDCLEIERKFLIAYPLEQDLRGAERVEISQTYLLSENGETHRIRRWICKGKTRYFETRKRRITDVTCIEGEKEIDRASYEMLLALRDPTRTTVEKVRYRLPCGAHLVEIDVYPFWRDRAIMEVELGSEDEAFEIPSGICILREVTNDPRYKNASLARSVPQDPLEK